MRRFAVSLLVAAALATAAPPADAESPTYQPPVDGPVVDPFRPPAAPWAAGNRGVDYATVPGAPVRAAGPGEVVFAGQVGGTLHVVVLHPDGVRTTLSFLRSIAVHRGDTVERGQLVGTSGSTLHFGARVGDVYVDPLALFATGPPTVVLVPVELRRPLSEGRERGLLLDGLGGLLGVARHAAGGAEAVAGAAADAARWAGGAVLFGGELALEASEAALRLAVAELASTLAAFESALRIALLVSPVVVAGRLTVAGLAAWEQWRAQAGDCTPPGVSPPPVGGRRIAVLVAGLGSSSERAAVWALGRPAALGYADGDVVRFSYRGGTTRDRGYGASDTYADLDQAGARLLDLLAVVRAAHPGATIDVVAHSQGGLVARLALARAAAAGEQERALLGALGTVVTLGTPHGGADLAALAAALLGHPAARGARHVAGALDLHLDLPRGPTLRTLADPAARHPALERPPPAGVAFVSVAARADLVVPSPRSRLPGVRSVVVSAPGWLHQHHTLPGSRAARREIRLALAGLPPTCEDLPDQLADHLVGEGIELAGEVLAAPAAAVGGR